MNMIPPEARFLWDIEALIEIQKYPSTKNLLDASAIVRRLLIDSECLVHKVAKGRDFKPRFDVSHSMFDAIREAGIETPTFGWQNPDPLMVESAPIASHQVGLEDFLRMPIAISGGKSLSTKELILYTANVGGGIHHGTPREKDNAKVIHANASNIIIEGQPYPIAAVASTIGVIVRALKPLYERVRA